MTEMDHLAQDVVRGASVPGVALDRLGCSLNAWL